MSEPEIPFDATPYPQPHEALEFLIPLERLEPKVPKRELPKFHAAIRIALREYHVSRMLPLDFTHKQVTDFADSVLANWSMAITGHEQS